MLKGSFKKSPVKLDLQLFADGATASSGGAEGGAAMGQEAVKAEPASPQNIGRRSKADKNPLAAVQYGKAEEKAQDPTPVTEEQPKKQEKTETPEEREARFEKMIREEFPDLYGKRVKGAVMDRLKSTEETVESFAALQPVLEILGKRYGISKTDVKAIVKAVDEDDVFLEAESEETGTPTDQLRRIRSVTRENERLKEAERARKEKEESRRIYAQLVEDSKVVKVKYPSFDLQSELKNDQFQKLLMSGVHMQTAYEAIHAGELIPAAMSAAAEEAEARVMDSIRANGFRPSENGNRSSSTAIRKTDVHSFTRADRAEIARRALGGEKITF